MRQNYGFPSIFAFWLRQITCELRIYIYKLLFLSKQINLSSYVKPEILNWNYFIFKFAHTKKQNLWIQNN